MNEKIQRMAYFFWRKLPPGNDLDDITSEAMLGALTCRSGCEVIAAKRAIIEYLRRCYPGSRGTRRQCLQTIWWLPSTAAKQERILISEDLRQHLLRAVDTLTAKELAVILACFWSERTQAEEAQAMGTTEAYFSRVKGRAIGKLRAAMEGA